MQQYLLVTAVFAFLFNLVFVIVTWPMGSLPPLGPPEFARAIFQIKNPSNIIFVAMFLVCLVLLFRQQGYLRLWRTIALTALVLAGILLSWSMDANRIFRALETPIMASSESVDYPTQIEVVSLTHAGISHAYPLQYLAYHHLVSDSIADLEVDVTYCVLADTVVAFERDGTITLELIAARENNSVYRDLETGSWWQQSSGESIAGELQGNRLKSVATERSSFDQWRKMYPQGKIMLADEQSVTLYDQFFPTLWPQD